MARNKPQPKPMLISQFIFKTLYWPNSFLNHTQSRNYPIRYCSTKPISSYWYDTTSLHTSQSTPRPGKVASYALKRGGCWRSAWACVGSCSLRVRWAIWIQVADKNIAALFPVPAGDTQASLRQSSLSSATEILFGKVWTGWMGIKTGT